MQKNVQNGAKAFNIVQNCLKLFNVVQYCSFCPKNRAKVLKKTGI